MPISSKVTLIAGFATLLLTINSTIRTADDPNASQEKNKESSWKEWKKWGKDNVNWAYSVATFVPTIHANDYLGQGPCTFHAMLEPFDPKKTTPYMVFNANDEIVSIYDARKALLCLGNIPRSADHFKQFREAFNLPADALVGLHTLNRKFEQKYVLLKTSIQKDGRVKQYRYDTTDCTAPSQIDITRALFEIDNRDWNGEFIVLVHCKAGKGRSATIVGAHCGTIYYIGQKLYENGTPYTKQLSPVELTEKVDAYMKKRRPVVNINGNQKPALYEFFGNFQKAESIQSLYIKNIDAIMQRKTELKQQS